METLQTQYLASQLHRKTTPDSPIQEKIEELNHSVSQVYKYELLTTNQYLQQMQLVLEIFNEISQQIAHQ